jgi:ABC-type proline/glycine betaine transport system substrate-binding protein
MRTTKRRQTLLTIAMVAVALAMAAANPTFARGAKALTIRAVAIHGRTVTVSVANLAPRALHGMVVARILTRSGIVAVVASVDVAAGSTSTVRADLPETALDVPPLGVVVDDGVPF